MGQPCLVEVTGALTVSPVVGPAGCGPSLYETMQVWVRASYGASKSGRPYSNGTTMTPFVIPFEGISKVHFLMFRCGVPMKLLLTSPNGGVDQIIPVSDELLLHVPAAGDELTAIKIVGLGDVQYVLAGESG